MESPKSPKSRNKDLKSHIAAKIDKGCDRSKISAELSELFKKLSYTENENSNCIIKIRICH